MEQPKFHNSALRVFLFFANGKIKHPRLLSNSHANLCSQYYPRLSTDFLSNIMSSFSSAVQRKELRTPPMLLQLERWGIQTVYYCVGMEHLEMKQINKQKGTIANVIVHFITDVMNNLLKNKISTHHIFHGHQLHLIVLQCSLLQILQHIFCM